MLQKTTEMTCARRMELKRKPGSYFQNHSSREKSLSANEFVLVERVKRKTKNQQCCCFARVSSAVSRGLRAERRSELSVNKNDSNADFPQHTHTTSKREREREEKNNGKRKGRVGGVGARDDIAGRGGRARTQDKIF